MPKYVLFTVGRDKPGIVSTITEILYNYGCNLEDSSMTILKDQFAIILIVDVPGDVDIKLLESDVASACDRLSLFYVLKELGEVEENNDKYYTHCLIKVFGEDKTGIVYKVSRALAERGVNICDLRTKITSGEKKLYVMVIETEIPHGVTVEEIESTLSDLAREMDVDIVVEEVPIIRM